MKFWKTLYRIACLLFGLVILAFVVGLFLPKLRQIRQDEKKIAALEEAIRRDEEKIRELRNQQERFQNDPAFVERIAREELGKARPGDTIYRFSDPPENDPPRA